MTALIMWTVEIRDTEEAPWRPMTVSGDSSPSAPVYAWRTRDLAAEMAGGFERSRLVRWDRQEES